MATQIPWIGYRPDLKYYDLALSDAGIEVLKLSEAQKGLDAILQTPWPLIIVQGWVSELGGVNVRDIPRAPGRLAIDPIEPQEVACYIIGSIRKSPRNADTPVLVTTNSPEQADYDAAGATRVVNVMEVTPFKLVPLAEEYLAAAAHK